MNATGVRVRDKDLTCEIFREKKKKRNRQFQLRVNLLLRSFLKSDNIQQIISSSYNYRQSRLVHLNVEDISEELLASALLCH